jgi:hypothetical protein
VLHQRLSIRMEHNSSNVIQYLSLVMPFRSQVMPKNSLIATEKPSRLQSLRLRSRTYRSAQYSNPLLFTHVSALQIKDNTYQRPCFLPNNNNNNLQVLRIMNATQTHMQNFS